MARNLVCSECGGKMEIGIVVDRGHGNRPIDASYWMEGTDHKAGFWIGTINTEGREKYYINALRCENCGFLKFYAGPDNSQTNK